MKRIIKQCFGGKSSPSIDGKSAVQNSNLSLFQGVLAGLLLLTTFFLALSYFDRESFARRFLSDFYDNQRSVIALSKDRFSPQYSALMRSLRAAQTGDETPNIFVRYDEVLASSQQITLAAATAKQRFSFDDFSGAEQDKIDNFYAVLEQMDSGRHDYLLSLGDCLRLSVDGAESAEEFCNQLASDWQRQAARLLDELVAALELSAAERSTLEGIF